MKQIILLLLSVVTVEAQVRSGTGETVVIFNNPQHVICDSGCSGGGVGGIQEVNLSQILGAALSATNPIFISPGTGATFPVTGTFWQALQPVSFGALPTGNNVIGHVIVDTAPTTAVTGTFWQATQPVSFGSLPTGGNAIGSITNTAFGVTGALPSGTNVIGHVINDTGSTTAVTGNVTVIQGTGTNLHVVVDTAPTTAVTGTFYQATQPVSIASMPSTPVTGTFWQATQPVSGTFWQATQPVSGTVTTTPPANASENLAQIAGTNTVNGGLAGTLGVGGTAGNNAAITQNPVLVGCESLSAVPTVATTGNQRRCVSDLAGNQFNVYPFAWTCNLQALAATLTQCQAAPSAGYSLYVTQIVATTTTAVAGTFAVRYGTGANCVTSPIGVWPQPGGAGPTRVVTAPIVTAAPMQITFGVTGFKVAAANAVCVIGVVTNTIDISISGYIAP